VAERHGRGDAGLAGMDRAAVFGGEPAEIEKVDVNAAFLPEHCAGDLREAERLRDLARTGLVGAR
jgi:hypothetical protein